MDKAIVEWMNEKVQARCINCKRVVHLCFDERMSHKWTCYGCGRVHFSDVYQQSLIQS